MYLTRVTLQTMSVELDSGDITTTKNMDNNVKFVAFSGGGAKGNIYSGVYRALKDTGIMDGVEAVSGSSAGAITAAFVATGIDISDFDKVSKTTNLGKLIGKDESSYYPGKMSLKALGTAAELLLKATGKMHADDSVPISVSAKPLYELLQNVIRNNVATYLIDQDFLDKGEDINRNNLKSKEEIDGLDAQIKSAKESRIEELCKKKSEDLNVESQDIKGQITSLSDKLLSSKDEKESESIKSKLADFNAKDIQNQYEKSTFDSGEFRKNLEDLQNRAFDKDGKIYFKDVGLLKSIDNTKFKDLIVTATRQEDAQLELFSPSKTPNVEIAAACKASASIPLAFEKTKIDGKEYVDGGYRNNIPIKFFGEEAPREVAQEIKDFKDVANNKKDDRVLAFAFGSVDEMSNKVNTAIYSAKEKINNQSGFMTFMKDVVFKFLNGIEGRWNTLIGKGTFKYSESEENLYQDMRKNALNTVVLDTKKVGTLSFSDAQSDAEYLNTKGYIQTMNHAKNHNIGKIDPNLEYKEVFLAVYEESKFNRSTTQSFKDKIIGQRESKLSDLLNFAKEETWIQSKSGETKSTGEIIENFIMTAAKKRSDGQLSSDTKTMGELIKVLNDPKTSSKIKASFAEAIGIDYEKIAGKTKFTAQEFDKKIKELEPRSRQINNQKQQSI